MSKLSKPLRLEVLKNAKLRTYLPDEYVFRQGEPGKSMFVIIIGSVNVLVNGKNPRNGENSEYVWRSNSGGCEYQTGRDFRRARTHQAASTRAQDLQVDDGEAEVDAELERRGAVEGIRPDAASFRATSEGRQGVLLLEGRSDA